MTGNDMQCAVTELCVDGEMPPSDIHTQLQHYMEMTAWEPSVRQ